jgi:hypothetical protein
MEGIVARIHAQPQAVGDIAAEPIRFESAVVSRQDGRTIVTLTIPPRDADPPPSCGTLWAFSEVARRIARAVRAAEN